MKNINTIISVIEKLEAKRAAGTITMDEESQLIRLVELAETMLAGE